MALATALMSIGYAVSRDDGHDVTADGPGVSLGAYALRSGGYMVTVVRVGELAHYTAAHTRDDVVREAAAALHGDERRTA